MTDRDLEAVQRRALGATRDRMLRELVEALESLSLDEPLAIVLEDLHWSDSSTIDLLARLARRREAARLLVVGTYRPAELAAVSHPLHPVKQELEVHGQCAEMPLEYLGVAAVREYLAHRFPEHGFPPDLAVVLHRNTNGNPLFVVTAVDDLIAQGRVREVGRVWSLAVPVKDVAANTPGTLSHMVERHVERLTPDEQSILTVASVTGVEFSAAIAAADGFDTKEAERRCEALARRGQLLRAAGDVEWPDGTVAGRYAFIHALYQQVLYARIPVTRRVGLHLRTGERLERAYGPRAGEIAGELAVHFEHGRDLERAVRYRQRAAENALRQHGHREAAEHARRALQLLGRLPASREHVQQELALQVALGTALTVVKGYSAPEVEQAYGRALELCRETDDTPRLFPVLLGLGWFYIVRGPSLAALDVGRRLLAVAEATGDPAASLAAHNALGTASFYGGEFEAAHPHLEQGMALYDPAEHNPNRSLGFLGGLDPGLSCKCHDAWTLWALGYPTRAAARMRDALALARSVDHPFTLAHACRFAAAFHLSRGERDAVRRARRRHVGRGDGASIQAVSRGGEVPPRVVARRGGTGAEGLPLMHEWIDVCRNIRAACLMPTYLGWLAETYGKIGRPVEGLELVTEAWAVGTQSGHRYWTAELHRVKGELTLQSDRRGPGARGGARARRRGVLPPGDRGRSIAAGQALRAARDHELVPPLGGAGTDEGGARGAVGVYGWFTEGLDTADLKEAKSLLDELDRRAAAGSPTRVAPSHFASA